MPGFRKLVKLESRRQLRAAVAKKKKNGGGTDKPSTRKFGVYFSIKNAELKAGARFRHPIEPSPVPVGNEIPLRLKYRPMKGMK